MSRRTTTRPSVPVPVRVLGALTMRTPFSVVATGPHSYHAHHGKHPLAVAAFDGRADAPQAALERTGRAVLAEALGVDAGTLTVTTDDCPGRPEHLAGRLGALLRVGQMCGATAFPSAGCLAELLGYPVWLVEAGLREYRAQQREG